MDMKIDSINTIRPSNIYAVLRSPYVPQDVKRIVATEHKEKILSDIKAKVTSAEYATLLETRPLKKGRPLKNSMIKRADMYILAGALGIEKSDIEKYIENIVKNNFEIQENAKKEDLEITKQYLYRHGKKDDVMKLLEHELSDAKHMLIYLYRTLERNTGGVFDYFIRPIHLLDNRTAKRMHKLINSSLKNAQEQGFISSSENLAAADFALKQIYNIQSNYKLLKAAQIVRYEG